jgi:hypothetical protein
MAGPNQSAALALRGPANPLESCGHRRRLAPLYSTDLAITRADRAYKCVALLCCAIARYERLRTAELTINDEHAGLIHGNHRFVTCCQGTREGKPTNALPVSITTSVAPLGSRAPIPTRIWHCESNDQSVFSDSPCGLEASVQPLSEINRMDAHLRDYDYLFDVFALRCRSVDLVCGNQRHQFSIDSTHSYQRARASGRTET